MGDNEGKNISYKNESYNELTVQYWVWKNDCISDIVGFCHYRRFFTRFKKPKTLPLFMQILRPKEIRSLLLRYDIICNRSQLGMVARDRIETNASSLRSKDIEVVKGIIFKLYGKNDAEAFDIVMNRKWNYLLNMFICSKELLDSYSAWLFSILEKLEEKIDQGELLGNEKRIFGLWGEYLLSTFIVSRKFNVYDCALYLTGPHNNISIKSKKKIASIIKRNH